jgi:hypothetical protein
MSILQSRPAKTTAEGSSRRLIDDRSNGLPPWQAVFHIGQFYGIGRQTTSESTTVFETEPRLPWALTNPGTSRQALGDSPDRKVPSGRAATCQEVLAVRPLTVMVTNSAPRKPVPHTIEATAIGGTAAATS